LTFIASNSLLHSTYKSSKMVDGEY